MDYELKNIDPEEIEYLLGKVEESFGIKFGDNELHHIFTFGQLCDHIISKIKLDDSRDCTTQQAFYKLRASLSTILNIDKNSITPETLLSEILPRENRISKTKKIEKDLKIDLSILRPPHFISAPLIIISLLSFFLIFFYWKIGLSVFTFSILLLWFVYKIGKELDVQTVGQLVDKMTRENYLKSRRNSKTFNKNEIEKVLTDLFANELDLTKSKLTREAQF